MDSFLFKHVRWVAGMVLAGAILWIGVRGIHRGLWLDEAWVANSIGATSLAEMFRGGEWLQTSPPLFLLVARTAIKVFGLSTPALRSVPLLFALIATIAMWFASRRAAPTVAPITTAALMLPSLSIEYFMSFKQYGGEAAAVAIVLWAAFYYLESPERARFVLLCAIVTGLLPLAYPLAFVAPGIVLAVWRVDGWRRACVISAGLLAMLAAVYLYFTRPNVSPNLWQYWSGGLAEAYSTSLWLLIAAGGLLTVRAARNRNYAQLVCLLPCLLLVVAERTGLYPASARMRLFVRPCVLLGGAMFAEEFISRWRWSWLRPVVAIAAIAWSVSAASKYRAEPIEDYASTVAYLREHLEPGDLLLVHADARQGLRLYAAMAGWELPAIYGDTGWPCCLRNHASIPAGAGLPSSEEVKAVRQDLARMIPGDFHGRIWLVYASRWLHWRYVGMDEGDLWRSMLWTTRGCPPLDYVVFPNVAISPMDCTKTDARVFPPPEH
jgi:hypothetical protein